MCGSITIIRLLKAAAFLLVFAAFEASAQLEADLPSIHIHWDDPTKWTAWSQSERGAAQPALEEPSIWAGFQDGRRYGAVVCPISLQGVDFTRECRLLTNDRTNPLWEAIRTARQAGGIYLSGEQRLNAQPWFGVAVVIDGRPVPEVGGLYHIEPKYMDPGDDWHIYLSLGRPKQAGALMHANMNLPDVEIHWVNPTAWALARDAGASDPVIVLEYLDNGHTREESLTIRLDSIRDFETPLQVPPTSAASLWETLVLCRAGGGVRFRASSGPNWFDLDLDASGRALATREGVRSVAPNEIQSGRTWKLRLWLLSGVTPPPGKTAGLQVHTAGPVLEQFAAHGYEVSALRLESGKEFPLTSDRPNQFRFVSVPVIPLSEKMLSAVLRPSKPGFPLLEVEFPFSEETRQQWLAGSPLELGQLIESAGTREGSSGAKPRAKGGATALLALLNSKGEGTALPAMPLALVPSDLAPPKSATAALVELVSQQRIVVERDETVDEADWAALIQAGIQAMAVEIRHRGGGERVSLFLLSLDPPVSQLTVAEGIGNFGPAGGVQFQEISAHPKLIEALRNTSKFEAQALFQPRESDATSCTPTVSVGGKTATAQLSATRRDLKQDLPALAMTVRPLFE